MINKESQLSDSIFSPEISQRPTRDGYGEGLVLAGRANKNVVALTADLSESTRTNLFGKEFPERFFEVGVAEQNMVTVASGMAISGKIPFVSSYATFSPGRNWEQIRTTVAYNNANVKIAGHHAGVSVGPDGATHQALEDIALMRVMPNMNVIVPADAIEAKKATLLSSKIIGPTYLRFGREKTPVFTTEATPFVFGKANVLWRGRKPQVGIIGCGPILYNALLSAKALQKEKIEVVVLNMHTIKPLDKKAVLDLAKTCGSIVTVEEHQTAGGLGSAIAELLASNLPTPIEFVGMKDLFGESGTPNQLMKKYEMDENAITLAVKRAVERRIVMRG
jgi:transketolase